MMGRKLFAGLILSAFGVTSGALAQPVTRFPPASIPLSGSEQMYIIQNGISKKLTIGDLTGSSATINVGAPPYNAKCDSQADDSPPFTKAIRFLAERGGGTVLVPATGHSCVLKEGIILGDSQTNGVSLRGVAGSFWGTYDNNNEADWTKSGSWIRCDDKVNACITVAGEGSTMDGLNFWYTQPLPPGGNCGALCTFTHDWNPIVYPYTIAIKSPQNFNHFSNLNIVNATHCIDMEGPETGVGSFFTYFDHLQLGCFNSGMKFNRVDNAIAVNDVKFLVLWYQAYANVWGYMEGDTTVPGHKVDIDMSYLSDPSFNAVQFYQSAIAIRAATASVGSGLGTVTFAAQGLQFTNTIFNQVCQAFVTSNAGGPNPIINGDFANTTINIDPQTSFQAGQCGQATPIAFDLKSDNVDLSFTNINGFIGQQLVDIGGGISGGVHISGRARITYSTYAPGAPAIHVNPGAFIDMANGINNLFPANASAGPQCAGNCRNWPVVPAGDPWIAGAPGIARQQLFLSITPAGGFQARWGVKEDGTAETGSLTGSNFGIDRYADNGSFLDTPFQISRVTGQVLLPDGLNVINNSWISGPSNVPRQQLFLTTTGGNTRTRWGEKADATAETGSNTGSNYGIDRYADDASFIDTPFQINRASGQIIAKDGFAVTGGLLSPPTYTVSGLPLCNGTTNVNAVAVVVDALAPTYLAVLAGGGTVHTTALCNAANWIAN